MIDSIKSIVSPPKPLNANYCVKISQPLKGETAIYRQEISKDKLITSSLDKDGKEFESL